MTMRITFYETINLKLNNKRSATCQGPVTFFEADNEKTWSMSLKDKKWTIKADFRKNQIRERV